MLQVFLWFLQTTEVIFFNLSKYAVSYFCSEYNFINSPSGYDRLSYKTTIFQDHNQLLFTLLVNHKTYRGAKLGGKLGVN